MKKIFLITILSAFFFIGKEAQASTIHNGSSIHIYTVSGPLDLSAQAKTSPYKRQNKFKAFAKALAGFFTLAVLSSHVNSDNSHSAPATLLVNKSIK